jgi:serine protein kinase
MPGDPIDFAALIEQDRSERQKLEWQGTFLQYLDLVKQRPQLADLSHRRMYDMMAGPGVTELDLEADPRAKRVFGDETVKVYNFFADEFFGMERTLEKIVRYFHSAAMGGEEARQVLYLMGPVGSGKSSLVERLKRGLEDLEPLHVIEGCPIFEQPLHLIPRHLRKAFEDMLGVKVEGDLCPVCRWRLINEHDGKYENVPIKTLAFSKRARRGIGVVPPVDPNNQDTSVLIGS